jgi:PEP-CTERM motif
MEFRLNGCIRIAFDSPIGLLPPHRSNSLQINLGTFDGALPTVAAVPEPGTWLMMILGFCGIGLLADGGARRVVARA